MELSWLQNLNLLLSRTVKLVNQADESTANISKEVKFALLCLACRRKLSGGKREVTNEHLTKAIHYFDMRLFIHDMHQANSDELFHAPNSFARHFYTGESGNGQSDNQHGARSSTKKRKI
ncbi:hypothetical protein FNYG_04045 [Fusarium nygamai]|uniref:Uncharacterized protein n=1 Tax=Gibberella nygamai TaxID=42673 RepID=A0A2K0WKL6_GIBNY|nr:hypothetical protein FNYG_04045 [Fusarium nygamai]